MARSPKSPNRPQRVADQIQRDLSELIAREVRDPRVGLVTISGVELTPDYAHAKIHFTVIGSPAEATLAGLEAASGHLHKLLFRRIRIHTVPRLHFLLDTSVEKGFEMEQLIRSALDTGSPPASPLPPVGAAPAAADEPQ
jgi:ribosome-binding factor A